MKSFAGEIPALKDIGIAKNYLTETELKVLNNLVSGYFDFAEISALERRPMYMILKKRQKNKSEIENSLH